MRFGNRWSILGLGLVCLMAFWAWSSVDGSFVLAEGAPAAADSNPTASEVADAQEPPSSEEAPLFLEQPERINLSHEGCHAKVFCADGSTRECEGSAGESCSTGSESCQGSTCTSTRKFALCGTEKVTCPCECPTCPDPDCPAGDGCRSSKECGPCGACFSGKCLCIA